MRRLTIICAVVLAGCGNDQQVATPIPPGMVQSCPTGKGGRRRRKGSLCRRRWRRGWGGCARMKGWLV